MIFVKSCKVGGLETNCYLMGEHDHCYLIDPGAEPEKIEAEFQLADTECRAIISTHGHYDHIGAIAYLKRKYDIPVYMHEAEKELLKIMFAYCRVEEFNVDHWLKENDVISVAGSKCQVTSNSNLSLVSRHLALCVLHTPGHTSGGICLYNNEFIFTGDTLFADGYLGRTDLFIGGSRRRIKESLKKILQLPENLKVYPGHEAFTTLAAEKKLHHKVGNMV